MGQAGTAAADSNQLRAHPHLSATVGAYHYDLLTNAAAGTPLLSVNDSATATTKKLLWAIGDGVWGQSYVYREGSQFYESQLSFYSRENSLATTTGHMPPRTLDTAAGGQVSPPIIRQCFGCHFTASSTGDRFQPERAIPGLGCEACHGPGLNHVVLNTTQGPDSTATDQLIMNPARLNPADSVDFCGACHRTSSDAVLEGLAKSGLANVRLQPYRLQKSKCWGNGDPRITCTACHDPHNQLVTEPHAYDAKCLSCHVAKSGVHSRAQTANACVVGTENCVTCHMAKIEVPGTHATFTDHWIRIVRKGAPYPE